MPFLRFTRSNSGHDHRTWFRKVFFEDLDWREGISGRGLPMEWAEIKLDVTIEGAELGCTCDAAGLHSWASAEQQRANDSPTLRPQD